MRYILFNDKASTDPYFGIKAVQRIRREVLPATRDYLEYIRGMDGVLDYGKDDEEGYIGIRLWLASEDFGERIMYTDRIAGWLDTKEVKALIISDQPDKRYMARRVNRINIEGAGTDGHIDITFMYPEKKQALTTKTATTFPAENTGTAPCPCIITATMTGPESSLKITLAETGEFVLINHDLEAADEVVIDTNSHEVTVNGDDARPDLSYLSDYFDLPVGEFNLETDEAADIEVEWRERWK